MKSIGGESQKKSGTEPDSAEIYDFLYADRARISALYAQLFPQGILTSVKTTAQETFADDKDIGTDFKVFKAGAKTSSGGSEGIEHQFDTTWSIPLEVLDQLKAESRVRDSVLGAGLGSIILTDCRIRIVDFASMAKMWGPTFSVLEATGSPVSGFDMKLIPVLTEAISAMPHAIHGHFLTNQGFLWSSLQPESLTIPASDLSLKYGGQVPGQWKILYLLDAWMDNGEPPNFEGWSAGVAIDGILTAMHGLKTIIGRPPNWYGVTPLMIFRDTRGWLPSQDLASRK